MTRTDLAIATPDGTCMVSLHAPTEEGTWPGVILYPDAGGTRETFRAMGDRTLTPAMSVRDARALIDALASRPEVVSGPVGTVGYCMGGRTSLIVAGHLGDRVGAAASVHGGRLAVHDDPDSPHHRAAHISAQLYVGAASDDDSFDAVQEDTLRRALDTADVRYRLETYPALHGFAVADNPTYDESSAIAHWKALAELFAGALVR